MGKFKTRLMQAYEASGIAEASRKLDRMLETEEDRRIDAAYLPHTKKIPVRYEASEITLEESPHDKGHYVWKPF